MRLRMAMAGVLTLVATGCGKSGPPPPPVLVDSSQLETKVFWSSDLENRRIVIDGYIGFDNGPTGEGIALGPELTSEPFGKGEELIRFDLDRGAGPNQMQLPVLERRSDPGMPSAPQVLIVDIGRATFQDSAGKPHPFRDRVRSPDGWPMCAWGPPAC